MKNGLCVCYVGVRRSYCTVPWTVLCLCVFTYFIVDSHFSYTVEVMGAGVDTAGEYGNKQPYALVIAGPIDSVVRANKVGVVDRTKSYHMWMIRR